MARLLRTLLLAALALPAACGPADGSPTADEVAHYRALKALRRSGTTCPNGQVFPPNPAPFLFDCRLWRAARLHAADMAGRNYFSHYSKGSNANPCDRTQAQGFSPPACSENIAAGKQAGVDSLAQFRASPEHCPNMMDPSLNRFAVGSAANAGSQYRFYWVEDMGVADAGDPWVDQSCRPPDTGEYVNPPKLPPNACRDLNPAGCAPFAPYKGTDQCDGDWTRSQCQLTCGFCSPR